MFWRQRRNSITPHYLLWVPFVSRTRASRITMLSVLIATAALPPPRPATASCWAGGARLRPGPPRWGGRHRFPRRRAGLLPAAAPRHRGGGQPARSAARQHGTSDTVDAAADAVLSPQAYSTAKTGDPPVETLRMRQPAGGLSDGRGHRHCLHPAPPGPAHREPHHRTTAAAAADHHRANTHAPKLLQRHRAGPDSAAALLTTVGDNPDRMHGEASSAPLCWVSPIEALSGRIADAGPTAATTAAPAPLSTASPSAAHAVTTAPAPSSTAAPPKVSPDGKPSAV